MSTEKIQEVDHSVSEEKILSEKISPAEPDEVEITSQTSYVDQDGHFIELPPAQQRRLMMKIDLHIVPLVALLYWLSGLNDSDFGRARLFGLEQDLHMSGVDFNVALLMYSITHILFQIPSNLILKMVRPSLWLPCTLLFY
jgi:hypothetical protein